MSGRNTAVIQRAEANDLRYVEYLAGLESRAVGFIPKPAYEAAITGLKAGKRWSPTCTDGLWICRENDEPVGFVLASFGQIARIAQIAIQEDARLVARGQALLEAVATEAARRGLDGTQAGCADDLPSNSFWEACGFQVVGQRAGVHFETKRKSGRTVNIWRRYEHQLYLFDAVPMELSG